MKVIPINSFLVWINFGVILEHTLDQTKKDRRYFTVESLILAQDER